MPDKKPRTCAIYINHVGGRKSVATIFKANNFTGKAQTYRFNPLQISDDYQIPPKQPRGLKLGRIDYVGSQEKEVADPVKTQPKHTVYFDDIIDAWRFKPYPSGEVTLNLKRVLTPENYRQRIKCRYIWIFTL